jgi:hypothetical protein
MRGHSTRVEKVKAEEGRVKQEEESPAARNENGATHQLKQEDSDDEDSDGEDIDGYGGESKEDALDLLCLALGILTNLVQVAGEVKDILRDTG